MLKNKDFLVQLVFLAIPVSLQTILYSSRNISDVFMTSSFGSESVSALGIAGRYSMLATIILFGVASSAGQYLSQIKGTGDKQGFNKYFYSLLLITIPLGLFFALTFILFSDVMMSLFSSDKEVIKIGKEYITIISPQMVFAAIGISFNIGLRSLYKPSISTAFSVIGVLLNIFLNYVLIYGRLGFEPMGAKGAAVATTTSCIIEIVLLGIYLNFKNIQIKYSLSKAIQNFSLNHSKKILTTSTPITLSNLGIAMGGFSYVYIISLSGTEAISALSIILPIEALSLSFLLGLSSSATILIGGYLGNSEKENAYKMAMTSIKFTIMATIPFLLLLLLLESSISNLFSNLGAESLIIFSGFYKVVIACTFLKSLSAMITNGILRSGGDNNYCLKIDLASIWIFSVPAMMLLHFFFNVDVVFVYVAVLIEDLIKIVFGISRVKSGSWTNKII